MIPAITVHIITHQSVTQHLTIVKPSPLLYAKALSSKHKALSNELWLAKPVILSTLKRFNARIKSFYCAHYIIDVRCNSIYERNK